MARSRQEIIGGIAGVTIGLVALIFLASLVFGWLDNSTPARAPTPGPSPCASVNFDPAGLCASRSP